MLILSRKLDEAIICTLPNGDEIAIIVSNIKPNRVVIEVDANDDIEIMREELLEG